MDYYIPDELLENLIYLRISTRAFFPEAVGGPSPSTARNVDFSLKKSMPRARSSVRKSESIFSKMESNASQTDVLGVGKSYQEAGTLYNLPT